VRSYTIEFYPDSLADLGKLAPGTVSRVLKKLAYLANNFEQLSLEALTGELVGMFKLRIGDYRVIYTVDYQEKRIVVYTVKHRREVYR